MNIWISLTTQSYLFELWWFVKEIVILFVYIEFLLHVCLYVHTFLIELRTCTSLVSVAFLLIKFLPLYNSVYFDSFHKSKRRMFFFFFDCATIYNNYNFQYPHHIRYATHHLYLRFLFDSLFTYHNCCLTLYNYCFVLIVVLLLYGQNW